MLNKPLMRQRRKFTTGRRGSTCGLWNKIRQLGDVGCDLDAINQRGIVAGPGSKVDFIPRSECITRYEHAATEPNSLDATRRFAYCSCGLGRPTTSGDY
jgi:hypothetical protein